MGGTHFAEFLQQGRVPLAQMGTLLGQCLVQQGHWVGTSGRQHHGPMGTTAQVVQVGGNALQGLGQVPLQPGMQPPRHQRGQSQRKHQRAPRPGQRHTLAGADHVQPADRTASTGTFNGQCHPGTGVRSRFTGPWDGGKRLGVQPMLGEQPP
jgi:hypothetical protein